MSVEKENNILSNPENNQTGIASISDREEQLKWDYPRHWEGPRVKPSAFVKPTTVFEAKRPTPKL